MTGSGQNPGRALIGLGQKSGSGSDRVRDDVSMTLASGNLNRFDRVENGSGQRLGRSCDWVKLTSANQLGFRSGACLSRAVVPNARGGAWWRVRARAASSGDVPPTDSKYAIKFEF